MSTQGIVSDFIRKFVVLNGNPPDRVYLDGPLLSLLRDELRREGRAVANWDFVRVDDVPVLQGNPLGRGATASRLRPESEFTANGITTAIVEEMRVEHLAAISPSPTEEG